MPDETPVSSPEAEVKTENAPSPVVEPVGIFDEPKTDAPAEDKKESAPSEEAKSEPESKEEKAESKAEPEPAKEESEEETSPKPGSKAERRIKQLTAQLKAVERQVAELQKPKADVPGQMREPEKPSLSNFQTVEEYDTALEKYKTDYGKYVVEQDRMQRQKEAQEAAEKKLKEEIKTNWDKRADKVIKTNPEFDTEKYIAAVAPNDVTSGFLTDSEIGPHMLNYLYENPDEADKLRDMGPFAAARALTKLEDKISEQIKGIKHKTAPKPPPTVAGRASAPAAPKSLADILYG